MRAFHWISPFVWSHAFFIVMFGFYMVAAVYLVYGQHVIMGDALSRVGTAERVLFSRDPHLAAIGFVWVPLPILAVLPFVPLKSIWPDLVTYGFASNIVAAAFMAGAVSLLWRILLAMDISRILAAGLTAVFIVHPLIMFFGANGMSEAPFLFFLLLALHSLSNWTRRPDIGALVVAGVAVSLAFLSRYEGIVACASVIVVVGVVSFHRSQGIRRHRFGVGLLDALIVAGPTILVVGFWVTASWLIIGSPLDNATSSYGNTAQLKAVNQFGPGAAGSGLLTTLETLARIEPGLALVVLAGLIALLKRDVIILIIYSVLGPVLGFMLWAYAVGGIAHEVRYLIVAIPFTVLCTGRFLSGLTSRRSRLRAQGQSILRRAVPAAAAVAALSLTAVAIPSVYPLMQVSELALNSQHYENLRVEWAMASYLDRLNLPRGSILVDSFLGFPIIQASKRPDQFVATSDRDFKQVLADPAGAGVEYLLVPAPTYIGSLDAINRAYPRVYETGAGLGRLVGQFPLLDNSGWRLYRVSTNG